jgi:hypothetical protein
VVRFELCCNCQARSTCGFRDVAGKFRFGRGAENDTQRSVGISIQIGCE